MEKQLWHAVITLLGLCQLTKTANFIATPMKKHIYQFLTCLLEIQARFLFFFLTNENEKSLACRANFNHEQIVHHPQSTFPV